MRLDGSDGPGLEIETVLRELVQTDLFNRDRCNALWSVEHISWNVLGGGVYLVRLR
jgi:hypothetical protein